MRYILLITILWLASGCSKNPNLLVDIKTHNEPNLTEKQVSELIPVIEDRIRLLEYVLKPTQISYDNKIPPTDDTQLEHNFVNDLDRLIAYNDLLLEGKLSNDTFQNKNCRSFINTQNRLLEDLKKTLLVRSDSEYYHNNKRARIEIINSLFKAHEIFMENGREGGSILPVSDRSTCDIENRDEWITLASNVSNSIDSYTQQAYGTQGIFDKHFLNSLEQGIEIKNKHENTRFAWMLAADIGLSIVLWKYAVAKGVANIVKSSIHARKIMNTARIATFTSVATGTYYLDSLLYTNPEKPEEVFSQWNNLIQETDYLVDLKLNSPQEYSDFFWISHKIFYENLLDQIAKLQDVLVEVQEEYGSLNGALDEHRSLLEILKQEKRGIKT